MPKEILKTAQRSRQQDSALSTLYNCQQNRQEWQIQDRLKLGRMLGRPRSQEYVDAIRKMDLVEHLHSREKLEEIISTLKNEFLELEISKVLLGYVAVCYLGRPYEVHTLDMAGQIIEHYKAGVPLPNGLERARNIAMHGDYVFIEVYADCCRGVSIDGNVTVIAC